MTKGWSDNSREDWEGKASPWNYWSTEQKGKSKTKNSDSHEYVCGNVKLYK